MIPTRLAEITHKHGARTREGGWAECGGSSETCEGCYLLTALRETQRRVDTLEQAAQFVTDRCEEGVRRFPLTGPLTKTCDFSVMQEQAAAALTAERGSRGQHPVHRDRTPCVVCDLTERLATAEAVVRAAENIWGVIPVTGPGTLGPDVAVPLLAYEALRMALTAYQERA